MEHREEVRELARATGDLVDLVGKIIEKVRSADGFSSGNPMWAEWEQIRSDIKSRVDSLT